MNLSSFVFSSRVFLSPVSPIGISFRGYLASYWAKETRVVQEGHRVNHQHFGRHRKTFHIRMPIQRVSEIKRIRKDNYEKRMSYPLGRKQIMDAILKDKDLLTGF